MTRCVIKENTYVLKKISFAFVFMAVLWSVTPAGAQNETVLADFEEPSSLSLWEGLAPFKQTTAHASSGTHGMAIEVPKWNEEKGEDPRPRVRLPFADGKGYPTKDWSGYGAVAIDLWVDGAEMGGFGIKIEDGSGTSSWTTWIDVKPGRLFEAVLTMEEAAGDIDITDIQAVVLYALRPPYPFTITVDRLRLLPGKPVPAAELELTYPNYRGWILPDSKTVEVGARVHAREYGYAEKELQVALSLEAAGFTRKAVLPVRTEEARYAIASEGCPEGAVTLKAQLLRKRTKAVLQSKQWNLKKLSQTEVKALPVYVDRDNNTIVDGQPFFPMGFYMNSLESHIDEVADSPFNTLLIYGTDRIPKVKMTALLDKIQSKNLKLVYCMNDVYPRATYLEKDGWEGIKGNENMSRAIVEAYRDHPALLAWYLNDEIPREQQAELMDYYRRVREGDPGHPTLITLCQKKDFAWLWQTTDILSGDPYPIPRGKVTEVAWAMEKSKAPSLGSQPIWLVPQAFAWYQHDPKNTDRARIPSQTDLDTGRAPTYEEGRCMTYLGLTHGAKGLIYWCYYNMRVLPQYEEIWIWMKSIGQEVKDLSPALLTAQDLGPLPVSPASKDFHTLLKRQGNTYCLMAVNAGTASCTATFQAPISASTSVEVRFENRKLTAQKNAIADTFAPLAVHVYQWETKR